MDVPHGHSICAKANAYDVDVIYPAICRHFDALDITKDLTPDTRVLLKPNMLLAKDPADAATSHPVFLRAVTIRLRELGVKEIVLADSARPACTTNAPCEKPMIPAAFPPRTMF